MDRKDLKYKINSFGVFFLLKYYCDFYVAIYIYQGHRVYKITLGSFFFLAFDCDNFLKGPHNMANITQEIQPVLLSILLGRWIVSEHASGSLMVLQNKFPLDLAFNTPEWPSQG